jgi:hypothetical protein
MSIYSLNRVALAFNQNSLFSVWRIFKTFNDVISGLLVRGLSKGLTLRQRGTSGGPYKEKKMKTET